jgi:prepilin peptidase CpaA
MTTPSFVAACLGLAALPICLWAAYVDLSRLKIPNRAVLALGGVFLVVGLALVLFGQWSFADWAWRWPNLAVVLLVGMLLNAVWLIGAGDAKFAAAAAPFIPYQDGLMLLWLFPLALLGCWLLHRIAKYTFGRRLAPGWVSWESGKRFPMGIALAVTLLAYLAMAAAA